MAGTMESYIWHNGCLKIAETKPIDANLQIAICARNCWDMLDAISETTFSGISWKTLSVCLIQKYSPTAFPIFQITFSSPFKTNNESPSNVSCPLQSVAWCGHPTIGSSHNGYPLVTNIAMENHYFAWVNPL